jgi:hypothetical protein
VWDPASERYWRRGVQASGLALAEQLPPGPRGTRLTRSLLTASIDILPGDATDDELDRAAVVLLRHGARDEAATIWMGLAQSAWSSGDHQRTGLLIRRAVGAAPGRVDVALSQLIVDRDTPREASALEFLAQHAPHHPLVRSAQCQRQLVTFARPVPSDCRGGELTAALAAQGSDRYGDLTLRLATLPDSVAAESASLERDIVQRESEQPVLARRWHELARRDSTLGGRALGEFIVGTLLPKRGESPAHFVSCLLRFVNLICALEEAGNAKQRMEQRRARIRARQEAINARYSANASEIRSAQSRIAYLAIDGPRQELLTAIDALVPEFRREVRSAEVSQYATPGVPRDSALTLLLTPTS